jgi:cell division protein ZapA (FtsZ GTPase activity inhibitor)
MQKSLKISVFGKSYSIIADENDQEVLLAAELVNNIMNSKAGKAPQAVENEKIAVVAALQLALELNKKNLMLMQCESKAENLVRLLDQT